MKRLLFLMLLAFTVLNSNATTLSGIIDSTVSTTKSVVTSTVNGAVDAKNYVDTSGNFRLMYNDLKSGVLALATAFKVGATQILYIIGKKYFLMGIYAWIIVISCLFAVYFIYTQGNKFIKSGENREPLYMLILAAIMSLLFVTYTQLGLAINYTFNPEYYVLQEVINMVKTLKN